MNMDGQISVAQCEKSWIIKLEGDLRADRGAALLRLVQEIAYTMNPESQVVVDFANARLLDSTILGHLAKLAVLMEQDINKKPVFINPSQDIRHVLNNMGFDLIAELETACEQSPVVSAQFLSCAPSSFSSIDDVDESRQQGIQRVLAAHQLLASLNEENYAKFKDVIEHLKQADGQMSR